MVSQLLIRLSFWKRGPAPIVQSLAMYLNKMNKSDENIYILNNLNSINATQQHLYLTVQQWQWELFRKRQPAIRYTITWNLRSIENYSSWASFLLHYIPKILLYCNRLRQKLFYKLKDKFSHQKWDWIYKWGTQLICFKAATFVLRNHIKNSHVNWERNK